MATREVPPTSSWAGYGGGTTSFYYWYMWRFGWVFFLITLFFQVLAFFAGFLACCGRLGSAIAGLVAVTALFFDTIAVTLMTYVLFCHHQLLRRRCAN